MVFFKFNIKNVINVLFFIFFVNIYLILLGLTQVGSSINLNSDLDLRKEWKRGFLLFF
jgi:hypothetical protein